MLPRLVRLLAGALLLLVTVWAGARGFSATPPLGPLLDPVHGAWNGARAAQPLAGRLRVRGLALPVEVVVDTRGVPHIYAASEVDAYRALGYLVARDRLFQLELQTRAAAGRLSEWIGEPGLASDRRARRLGFPGLVARTLAEIDTTSLGYRSVAAYADGINSWIESMPAGHLPLEYRLLRRRPERWRLENTFFLLGRMALVLAANDPSLVKAEAAARVGWEAADALFPITAPIQEPIQPNGVDEPRLAAEALPPPAPADLASLALVQAIRGLRSSVSLEANGAGPVLGSNNWAVAPRRTAAGHALLAGDPHLELTLPSIWYQAHLVAPGLDVQGVTLPGAPWIIIGFNRDLAWSFTNTGADVNDYFRETVDDSVAPTRYLVDGEWRALETRVEVIRGSGGEALAVDTVRFTHRGPLRRAASTWMSMAWTIYRARSSAEAFALAGRARTAGEFLEAMGSYEAPAQNMLVADRRGTIAIRSTGRYPVRTGAGRGDVLLDGSQSSSDWRGALPLEFYPFSLNPVRGFLSSANQQPVDPLVNPRYFGAAWPGPWRALRINQLLRADSAVTADAMRRYQIDPISARAAAFLPRLLEASDAAGPSGSADTVAQEARRLLAGWTGAYSTDDRTAVLFEAVMGELGRRTWDELVPAGPDSAGPSPWPDDAVLLALLGDGDNAWWDDRRTPVLVERRDDIVIAALRAGLQRTRAEHGDGPGPSWRWDAVHRANIWHPLGIPSLSALDLAVSGGPSTLSPSSGDGRAGASWRMVVELGPELRAWGVYPGGQSGNPASPHYRDRLPAWVEGRLDSLVHPATSDEFTRSAVEARVRLLPRGR